MALEELKFGDDPDAREQLEAARIKFTAMLAAIQQDLEALWTAWDTAVDTDDAPAKTTTIQQMVAILNRRSYIRNLVRDVTAAVS